MPVVLCTRCQATIAAAGAKTGAKDGRATSCPHCGSLRIETASNDPMRSAAAGWVHADLNPPT